MGLDVPDLDDRPYADLVADARRRIPVHADEWTDHNAHDPGITILELLAWLAETYAYQLDRVTDEHRRKYLRLLDVEPRPPTPARTTVDVEPPPDAVGAHLPAGLALAADEGTGTPSYFETTAPVAVTTASIERVRSEHRQGRVDNTRANETDGLGFLAFGAEAETGSALYLGFDSDPFAATGVLDLRVDLGDDGGPGPVTHGGETTTFEPTVTVDWQYCETPADWFRPTSWRSIEVQTDGTTAFYESGVVSLAAPPAWPGAIEILNEDRAFHWLRCVVTEDGHEVPPRLDSIRPNVVAARHGRRIGEEPLVRADGATETSAKPGQRFRFALTPVLDGFGELELSVGGVEWTEVRDFDASGPEDPHYVLDRATETVQFGDERRGRAPAAGQRVTVAGYTAGGGRAGNVPASAAWAFTATDTATTTLETRGVYRFSSAAGDRPGAVVVGRDVEVADDDLPAPEDHLGETAVRVEVGASLSDGDVEVGASVPNGDVGFSPAVVRIDPGTTVQFVWVADDHTITVESQPAGGAWYGHPAPEETGHEYHYRFQEPVEVDAFTVRAGGATGGSDAESVDEALIRLRRDLRTPYRAVTATDYATLATHTPGLRFGRATAVVSDESSDPTDAGTDCVRMPTIRVVVVPFSTRPQPVPSEGFLRAVRHHLETHRLLTDRVTVEAPTFVDVAVDATVRLVGGAPVAETQAAVSDELDTFLDPLTGFDGDGWPFGRPLYRSEVYSTIESVPGVDCVLDLSISARGNYSVGSDGAIVIGETALFAPRPHSVTVRTDGGRCKGGD